MPFGIEEQIIAALQNGNSFRVEAGAGSGKTYSLNKVIEWIQENKWAEYRRKKQTVICITYTNAAVDVLAERLSKDSFILPSTIHFLILIFANCIYASVLIHNKAFNHLLVREQLFLLNPDTPNTAYTSGVSDFWCTAPYIRSQEYHHL